MESLSPFSFLLHSDLVGSRYNYCTVFDFFKFERHTFLYFMFYCMKVNICFALDLSSKILTLCGECMFSGHLSFLRNYRYYYHT